MAKKEEYKIRRSKLCEKIGIAHALIVGAPAPNDHNPFRQYNDFYYLCGVEVPQSYLLIDGATGFTTLFLPSANNKSRERDDEILTCDYPDQVKERTGVDAVLSRDKMVEAFQSISVLYTSFLDGEGAKTDFRSVTDAERQIKEDPWDNRHNRGMHFIEKFREINLKAEIKDVWPFMLEMRTIKSPSEIELLRFAGQLSAKGLCEAMRATRPGVIEYELAAVLQYHYLAGGSRDNGYAPIVAGGKNAFWAHYNANNCPLVDGDLLLIDCAPDYQYYTSDITRMWPVNGKYTPAQRAIYGFITEYHKCLLDGIRPGKTVYEIQYEAEEIMRGKEGEFEFANPAHATGPEWMYKFHNHLAHCVGLSVHDGVSYKERPLEPGMVFTVDPQMRIVEENLYLRVEDTVVVTETGIEVFTEDAPLELDDIEKMVSGDGIVQDYPGLKFDS